MSFPLALRHLRVTIFRQRHVATTLELHPEAARRARR